MTALIDRYTAIKGEIAGGKSLSELLQAEKLAKDMQDATQKMGLTLGMVQLLTKNVAAFSGFNETGISAFVAELGKSGKFLDALAAGMKATADQAHEWKSAQNEVTAAIIDTKAAQDAVASGSAVLINQQKRQAELAKAGQAGIGAAMKATYKYAYEADAATKRMGDSMGVSAKAAYDLLFNVGDARKNLSEADKSALDLARSNAEAAVAAQQTADAAQNIVSAMAQAVAYAQQLRANLGSGAINMKYIDKEIAATEALILATRNKDRAGMTAAQTDLNQIPIQKDLEQSTYDLHKAENEHTNGLRDTAAATGRVTAEQQKATASVVSATSATIDFNQAMSDKAQKLAADKALLSSLATPPKTGAGGGGKSDDAKNMAADLKLLDDATVKAKGHTAQLSQEYMELKAAYDRVSAAYKQSIIQTGVGEKRIYIEMARVREQLDNLKYGTVNIADTMTDAMVKAASSMGDALTDFFMSGFKDTQSFAKSVVSLIRDMIKDILHAIVTNKIVIPIEKKIIGGMDGTDEGTGIFGDIGKAISGFGKGFSDSVGSMLSGNLGEALAPVGELATSTAVSFGTLGTALGAIAGPLAAVGLVFAALKKTTVITATGIRARIEGLSTYIETFSTSVTSTMFGLIKHTSTKWSLAGATGDAIVQSLNAIFGSIYDGAKKMGLSAAAFAAFRNTWSSFTLDTKGMTADESRDAMTQWLKDIGSAMVNFGGQATNLSDALMTVNKDGETLYDTFIRVSTSLGTVNGVLAAFGKATYKIGADGAILASRLADAFGGLDQFLSATSNYADTFLTDAEKIKYYRSGLTQQLKAVNAQFGITNITLPRTRKEYTDLVAGINTTTDGGMALYAMLVANASEFDKYYTLVEAGSQALQDARKKESDILAELKKRYDDLVSAQKALLAAQAALHASDAAPGTELSQYNVMKKQYDETVNKAKHGDTQAASDMIGMGTALLEQAKLVFGNTAAYGRVYDLVDKNLGDVAAIIGQLAETVKGQLTAEVMDDITTKSTQQLLNMLAQIRNGITSLGGTPTVGTAGTTPSDSNIIKFPKAPAAAAAATTPTTTENGAEKPPKDPLAGTANDPLTTRRWNALLQGVSNISNHTGTTNNILNTTAAQLRAAALRDSTGLGYDSFAYQNPSNAGHGGR